MRIIEEGKARVYISKERKISAKLTVFYNPVMKLNRDISVLLLNSLKRDKLRIALPLAATGIRGIRFLKELDSGKIKGISFNDNNKNFLRIIKKNFQLNKINNFEINKNSRKKIKVYNEDANLFLLNSSGFDYIDLDPFGSPNKFLDNAVKRISRKGILAVTSTDTAALASYEKVCKRKYWATPLLSAERHEAGVRILIRKIQLIGAQYGKALTPVFSYYRDHYYRVFFECEKSKEKTDLILKNHGFYKEAGPMWLGKLWDSKLVSKMYESLSKESINKELLRFLGIIREESKINAVGFYDMHEICKKNKLIIPKKKDLLEKINGSETHFTGLGLRSDIKEKELIKLIKRLR